MAALHTKADNVLYGNHIAQEEEEEERRRVYCMGVISKCTTCCARVFIGSRCVNADWVTEVPVLVWWTSALVTMGTWSDDPASVDTYGSLVVWKAPLVTIRTLSLDPASVDTSASLIVSPAPMVCNLNLLWGPSFSWHQCFGSFFWKFLVRFSTACGCCNYCCCWWSGGWWNFWNYHCIWSLCVVSLLDDCALSLEDTLVENLPHAVLYDVVDECGVGGACITIVKSWHSNWLLNFLWWFEFGNRQYTAPVKC